MSPRDALRGARRVVVKVGSALLADHQGDPFARLAEDLAAVRKTGVEVVLVSSGAIALGWPLLGYDERPRDLPGLQAAAAAGQGRLISRWTHALADHGLQAAQVLLTHGDLEHRRRYLNARFALTRLLERGAVPVVNENDTVSVDEIKLGDNDRLAAAVCGLVAGEVVVLLTGSEGLFTRDPGLDPTASRVSVVEAIDAHIEAMAGPAAAFGTGGMQTKLVAAAQARAHGAATVIAPGRRPGVVASVLAGDDVGTLFVAPEEPPGRARKRWIATALRGKGKLFVDQGAARALTGGASLLPVGLLRVEGSFGAGDPVDVFVEGKPSPLARGLCALSDEDAKKMCGKKTAELRALFGPAVPDVLIHRDDLALLENRHGQR